MHILLEECPVCDWVEDRNIIRQLRFPMDCPGCGTRKTNEFVVKRLALGDV